MIDSDDNYRCGYIAIVGRPNVGKSTLLNHVLGLKLSITSRKPQTTRHQLLGVKTTELGQMIFVDTPGIHRTDQRAINRMMNRSATAVIHDVDVVLFLVQALKWTDEDALVLEKIRQTKAPVILVVSKIDQVKDRHQLLPFLENIQKQHSFEKVIPVSALKNENLALLEEEIIQYLPLHPPMFAEDEVTDRSTRFLVAEIIREKLVRELGKELPYQTTVMVDSYKDGEKLTEIHATIFVETKGQKAIIIGSKGQRLKSIGSKARQDIEKLIERQVFLQLWVKIKAGWSDSEQALRNLGYDVE